MRRKQILCFFINSIALIMGRTSDEEGESSTQVCKSEEADDRPLKKARYVWQIKGKYHLKKSDEDKQTPLITKNVTKEECTVMQHTCPVGCDNVTKSELNVGEETEGNIMSKDVVCVSSSETAAERQEPVIQVNECDESSASLRSSKNDSDHNSTTVKKTEWPIPVGTVFPNIRPTTSWQLRKWQARQVARCFVDNTINRVLEDMGFVPLPVDADDILEEFPMTESENDEGLEDEAVLMAIHRHGLQRNEGEKGTGENKPEVAEVNSSETKPSNESGNTATVQCACSHALRPSVNAFESLDPFHQRPVFWEQVEIDANKIFQPPLSSDFKNNEIFQRWLRDGGPFSSVIGSESSSDSDVKSCEDSIVDEPELLKEDVPTIDEEMTDTEKSARDVDMKGDETQKDKNTQTFEHNEFMDKAVAVAIQKKGLSKLSCTDYG